MLAFDAAIAEMKEESVREYYKKLNRLIHSQSVHMSRPQLIPPPMPIPFETGHSSPSYGPAPYPVQTNPVPIGFTGNVSYPPTNYDQPPAYQPPPAFPATQRY